MKLKLLIVLTAAIGVAAYVYAANYKDRLNISMAVPDDYIKGAVFTLSARYEVDGEVVDVELDDRMLENTGAFELELPARAPWLLRDMRAELRHPKYQPLAVPVAGNPHWFRQTLELVPARWTTDEKHTFIRTTHETSIAALDHLHWIVTDYFARPEWLQVNEAVQQDHQLLGMMAYAGGKKSGEWEILRQRTIAELGNLKEAIDERVYEPCPEGYEVQNMNYPPCGRQRVNVVYLEPDTSREAEQAEETRRVMLARADLAQRLDMEEKSVRFAGYQPWMWNSSAIGCPDEGQSYIEEEVLGYFIVFTSPNARIYYYHGRVDNDPFYCPEEKRKF